MIVCTDVDYRTDPDDCAGDSARAAALLFTEWSAAAPVGEWVERIDGVEPYLPGEFFRRELPCLLAVLEEVTRNAGPPELVVIDGYVTLDAAGTPGLGAHLYQALGREVAVIGVAKTAYRGSPHAEAVCRGDSRSPLYVTAAGMEVREAARAVQTMAGPNRLPTLLKRVDQLCRQAR
ncbi:endonuclease V [Deinococcus altitudinis]|uniref:endonuclease V n=1 Tax=Deinococcus altitudinis TaxID=468914 RepID=UPI0038924299